MQQNHSADGHCLMSSDPSLSQQGPRCLWGAGRRWVRRGFVWKREHCRLLALDLGTPAMVGGPQALCLRGFSGTRVSVWRQERGSRTGLWTAGREGRAREAPGLGEESSDHLLSPGQVVPALLGRWHWLPRGTGFRVRENCVPRCMLSVLGVPGALWSPALLT